MATGLLFAAYRARRVPTSGLVFAYIANLALIHWAGALIYALPWYTTPQARQVQTGFHETTYGFVALIAGVGASLIFSSSDRRSVHRAVLPVGRLAWTYIAVGLTSYLVLLPWLGTVPTLGAVLAAGWNLYAIGIALKCREVAEQERWTAILPWLVLVFLTPVITILTQGFLGFGVQVVIVVIVFMATTTRHRWRWTAASLLLIYPALSIYVAYMAQRDYLRQSVWGGDPMRARIERLYDTARSVEPFDITNQSHIQPIDERLNQNQLVGACVEYLDGLSHPFAGGETLWYGVIALVPRIVWPDKPVVAGSMGLVTRYTGVTFGAFTSVGIGQVMEFYMNFGTAGVIVGFFVFGLIVAAFDRAAAIHLRSGDYVGFTAWFLPGMALLQAGGSIVEITSSVAAGAATAYLLNHHVLPAIGFDPPRPRVVRARRARRPLRPMARIRPFPPRNRRALS